MKISKNNVLKAFTIFKNVYIDFEKKIENEEKLKNMINTWVEVFNAIDFNYDKANDDFLKAVKIVTAKTKYIPTIAEISDEMKKMYNKRIKDEEKQIQDELLEIQRIFKIKGNTEDIMVLRFYQYLRKKYSKENIICLIDEYIKEDRIKEKDSFGFLRADVEEILQGVYRKENE